MAESGDLFDLAMDLFDQARTLNTEAMAALLEIACAGRDDLRHEVESLLAHHDDAHGDSALAEEQLSAGLGGMFPDLIADATADGTHDGAAASPINMSAWTGPLVPERIGRYHILRRIGEGGMGAVFEAEQESPRRIVALKIIRSGYLSESMLKRFEREAHVLGQLQHPGIAQIYEAGIADSPHGKAPYFAMEFVDGVNLLDHARMRELGVRERVELVARIADALDHAHERGVIHRDLKPANILVTDSSTAHTAEARMGDERSFSAVGQPKVLDFGVARQIGPDHENITHQTNTGQIVGTLPYMAPEQVAGDSSSIDARCDVYALGVILYELLAGRQPHELHDVPVAEAARIIREDEPSRLSSVNPEARGDVETIVAKALEKEPERRYASAAELAADLRRYLSDQPIAARPASTFYQLRKFAKRNRALVGGVAATFIALLAGLLITSLLAIRLNEQRVLAVEGRRLAERRGYLASIAAATSAIGSHDVLAARRHLDAASPDWRGWEWRYLRQRLDGSLAVHPSATSNPYFISFDTGGVLRVLSVRDDIWSREELEWNKHDQTLRAGGPTKTFAGPVYRSWFAEAWAEAGDTFRIGLRRFSVNDSLEDTIATDVTYELEAIPPDAARRAIHAATDESGRYLAAHSVTGATAGTMWWIDTASEESPRRHDGMIGAWGGKLRVGSSGIIAICDGETSRAQIWNPLENLLVELRGHRDTVRAITISPDGARAVTGSRDTTIRLWDTQTGATLAIGYGHTDSVEAVAWSPDGRLIATGGSDATLRLWDANSLAPLATLHGHEGDIRALAFNADGDRIASIAGDQTVRVWDASTIGQPGVLHGHTSYVYPVAVSPDGSLIASGGWDRTVRLWDVRSRRTVAILEHSSPFSLRLRFSNDGSWLAAMGSDEFAHVWRIGDRPSLAFTCDASGLDVALAFDSADGRLLVGIDESTLEAVVADLTAGNAIRRTPISELSAADGFGAGDTGGLILTTTPSNGARAFLRAYDLDAAKADEAVRWQLPAGWTRQWAIGHINDVSEPVVIAPRSDELNRIGVWRLHDGREIATLETPDEAYAVAIHPDGLRIATAGRDQAIHIWNPSDFTEVTQLRGHTSYVWSLDFGPRGSFLISGSGDHTVRIWDAAEE